MTETSQEEELKKQEKKSMKKAHWIGESMWDGTKWSLTFLLASVPIAYALKLPDEDETRVFIALALAAVAGFFGGVLQWIVQVMTKSRIANVANVGKQSAGKRKAAYCGIGVVLLLQLITLAGVVGGQAFAVFVALRVTDDRGSLEHRLSKRIDRYIRDQEALTRIRGFCSQHADDDKATKQFGEACGKFKQPAAPSAGESRDIVEKLSH